MRRGTEPSVTYRQGTGLVIRTTIDTPEVQAEALRWTKGTRGEPVDEAAAEGADLSAFHRTALSLGTTMLGATADNATAITLAGTLNQLVERVEAGSARAAETASTASTQALEFTAKASQETVAAMGKIVEGAEDKLHKDLDGATEQFGQTVQGTLERFLRPEDGETISAIKEGVGQALATAQVGWHSSLTTTLSEVTNKLDPNNPASPLGALERRMAEQQESHHRQLTAEMNEVRGQVGNLVATATTATAVAVAQASTPAKGRPYEESVGESLEIVAAGMAASYTHTVDTVGSIRGCKKGDGVIEAPAKDPSGRPARVVIEATTEGGRRKWPEYFDEAERNRGAEASLGLVPSRELVPGGDIMSILGPNRIVLAFDPGRDDLGLVRSTAQLLVMEAERRLAQDRAGDLGLVDAKLEDARDHLLEMAQIIKHAMSAREAVGKVVTLLQTLQANLSLDLDQARAALRGAVRPIPPAA